MTVINCIGWSNTGKTCFIEACLRELAASGVKTAAVKFASHVDSGEPAGKDSVRFREAGADVAVVSGGLVMTVSHAPGRWDAATLAALFPDAEIAFIEGSPESGRPLPGAIAVIVAGNARNEAELKRPFSGFHVVVTADSALGDAARAAGLGVFAPEHARSFVNSIKEDQSWQTGQSNW